MTAMLLDSQVDTKDLKVLSKNIKDIEENDIGDFFEKIVNDLINNIDESEPNDILIKKLLSISSDLDIDSDELKSFLSNDELKADEKLDMDIDEAEISDASEILFQDLVKLSSFLKDSETTLKSVTEAELSSMDIDSKKFDNIIKNEDVLKDLKNTKNIKDLLNLAEKNDIKIQNFEFIKEKVFVEKSNEKLTTSLPAKDMKSEEVIKIIDNKFQLSSEKLVENIKNDLTHKENTLKNVLTQVIQTEESGKKDIISNDKNFFKKNTDRLINTKDLQNTENVQADIKDKSKHVVVGNKTVDIRVKSDAIQKQESFTTQIKKEIKIEKSKNDVINIESIEEKVAKDYIGKKTDKVTKEQIVKSDDIKVEVESKIQKSPKNESIQDIKNLQNNKTLSKDQTVLVQNNISSDEKELKLEKVENKEIKIEKLESEPKTNETANIHKNELHHKDKKSDVKHTLNTFAQDFKEQVESYKPPLMKVKMQLNPKGLGEVDVTMINRGNNLHITVNSNPNTIAIFSQNQTEFKNSLVNMGFSELNMSFNENGKNKDDNQGQKNKRGSFENFEEESSQDSFEIVTPIYI